MGKKMWLQSSMYNTEQAIVTGLSKWSLYLICNSTIVNTIQSNMDKRLFSCGVFIDLKKAFDTVDHAILLDKLNHYGFRGIINNWFSSYLQDRTQTTQVGPHISERTLTTCGAPQGSLLDPLLLLLHINDISPVPKNSIFIFLLMTLISFSKKTQLRLLHF